MQKEINFYQEMASEHQLQEYSKGPFAIQLNKLKPKKGKSPEKEITKLF